MGSIMGKKVRLMTKFEKTLEMEKTEIGKQALRKSMNPEILKLNGQLKACYADLNLPHSFKEKIEINYKDEGTWYPGIFYGPDQQGDEDFYAVRYEKTKKLVNEPTRYGKILGTRKITVRPLKILEKSTKPTKDIRKYSNDASSPSAPAGAGASPTKRPENTCERQVTVSDGDVVKGSEKVRVQELQDEKKQQHSPHWKGTMRGVDFSTESQFDS